MSEITLHIAFQAPAAQAEAWQTLLAGLARDEQGAYFEERVEPFGAAAEAALEPLLDLVDDSGAELEWSDCRSKTLPDGSTRFAISVMGGSFMYEAQELFQALFQACGVEALQIRLDDLEDG
ncbi:MAG: hypothetical protein V7752_04290 [Halopseudomonas sp.]